MKRQKILLWNGGDTSGAIMECQPFAMAIPDLPDPGPLRQAALIEYSWGPQSFQLVASACSLRTIAWGEEEMQWLHCKAWPTRELNADGSGSMIAVLIPVHYVTRFEAGPTLRISRGRRSDDIGLFPPIHAAPTGSVTLEDVERVIVQLLAPERN